MSLQLRPGRALDIPSCASILYHAFHDAAQAHGFPPDMPNKGVAIGAMTMLFANSHFNSVVATWDGKIAGSNFLFEDTSIAGLGPVTVAPELQGKGIGKALTQHMLDYARERNYDGVRLVQATYNNASFSLFTGLGFDVQEQLVNLSGPPMKLTIPGYAVRAAEEEDFDECNRLCRRVHGHDRASDLTNAIDQGSATVVEHEGRITGYATMVGFFGHAVGEGDEEIKALIGAAKSFLGPGLILPARNSDVLRWCLQNGLRVIQPMTLMTTGYYQPPRGGYLCSVFY